MKLFSQKIWQIVGSVEGWGRKFCGGSKFEVLLKLVSGWVEDPYCGEPEVSGSAKEERCVKD